MSTPIHITSDHVHYAFSADFAPVAVVPSGARITLELRDAYDRWFQRDPTIDRYARERDPLRTNPVTGPVAVAGVEPGDGLTVTIEEIDLGPRGYVAALPTIGALASTDIVPTMASFDVHDGKMWFQGRLGLPLRPMIGVIGIAPDQGVVPALRLGYHGGNLDFNDITTGTVLHFPVHAPGGLLSVGDVHASMGAGEVHSGVNIDATVTLAVERTPGAGWSHPWFETATEVMTMGIEQNLDAAIRQATRSMVQLLQGRLGLTYTEAVMVAGASVDLRLGQAGGYGVAVSAYAACPKAAFSERMRK